MSFALEMTKIVLKTMNFVSKTVGEDDQMALNMLESTDKGIRSVIQNDEFCMTSDGICVKNDEFRKARGH